MLIISFAAFMGNSLMCFVMFKKPRFHTASNVFVVSLAICYMFAACLVMPFTAGTLVAGRWPFGRVLCDIQGFTFLNLIWVSLLTLTIMAASRYFKVTNLSFYNKWFTLDRSIGMIMIFWVLAAAVLVVQITFGTATFQLSPEKSICYMPSRSKNQTENIINTVITLLLYTMLTIISIIAWSAIRRHGNHSPFNLERTQSKSAIELKTVAEERRTYRVLLAMITETLLIWLPAIIIETLEFAVESVSLPRQVHVASTFLWFTVSALHPITYGISYKPFAKEVVQVLPRSSLRRNKVHAEQAV